MIAFADDADYKAHRADIAVWGPLAASVLEREHTGEDYEPPFCAPGASYPTVLWDDLVVKFYGHTGEWRAAYEAELRAYRVLDRDPGIGAPELFDSGTIEGWPYLILARLPGSTWSDDMDAAAKLSAAASLGERVGRLHRLRVDLPPHAQPWDASAFRDSKLPPALVARAPEFIEKHAGDDHVFANTDLFEGNILVADGRVTGLLDWGDAMVVDRHTELAKIHLSVFGADKALLRAFLDAADWPDGPGFARRALAHALVRQVTGVAQHGHGFDNFFLVPRLWAGVGSLDELAEAAFGL